MKYVLLLLFGLMLGSCDSAPKKGADGYVFGNKQFYKETVQVKVITYSKVDFERQLIKYKLPKATAAFTQLKYPYDTCTIHMIDPSVRYEPEFVGHEFLHCVYGQWHTNNESKS